MSTPATNLAHDAVLLREDAGGICTLTLNRPRQYNALSEALIEALQENLDAIAAAFPADHGIPVDDARPWQAAVLRAWTEARLSSVGDVLEAVSSAAGMCV